MKGTFLDGRWLMFAAGVGSVLGGQPGRPRGKLAIVLAILATAGYACRDPALLVDQKHFSAAGGREGIAAGLPVRAVAAGGAPGGRADGRVADRPVARGGRADAVTACT